MADNDNFEWVDVLTGGVLAGNDPVASAFRQIQCIVVCACRVTYGSLNSGRVMSYVPELQCNSVMWKVTFHNQ